jgi:excinuclease ABC subunit C
VVEKWGFCSILVKALEANRLEMELNRDRTKRFDEIKARIARILPEDGYFFDAAHYPSNPGCYLMKDRRGTVIYVGKAKNLRDRLSSYFQSRHKDSKIERMVRRVRAVEVILVNNEWESLVLENNLIKLYKPRYNARLKADDSGYFYIIQTTEKYPRLLPYMRNGYNKDIERIPGKAIEKRYGPYLNRRFRDLLLEFIVDHFGFRTCAPLPRKLCLRFEIQRCCGACVGLITPEQYHARLAEAAVFLSYGKADIVDHTLMEMKRRMKEHAARLEFESAQRVYDKIEAMEKLRVKQIVERDLSYDQDVVYFEQRSALVMNIHNGVVLKLTWFDLDPTADLNIAREFFLRNQYLNTSPQEIIVNLEQDQAGLQMMMNHNKRNPVRIMRPDSEESVDLMKLCKLNFDYRMQC